MSNTIKVAVIDAFGHMEVVELKGVPSKGDTIPLFFKPFPRVAEVLWMPEKFETRFEGMGLDVLVTVE